MHNVLGSKSARARRMLACGVAAPLFTSLFVASCTGQDANLAPTCGAGIPCLDASLPETGLPALDASGRVLPDGEVGDVAIDTSSPTEDDGAAQDASVAVDAADAATPIDAPQGSDASDAAAVVDAADASAPDAADAGPQPVLLMGNQNNPYYIAVGGGFVYCASGSDATIHRVSVDGGTVTPIAANGARAITADAKNLYWVSGVGDIYQVAHDSTTPIKLASGQYLPDVIATDGTYVYWNQLGTNASFLRVPIGGGADAGYLTPSVLSYPSGITFVGGKIYLAIQNAGQGTSAATISVLPGDGGMPIPVVSGLYRPVRLINDGQRLFWVDDPGSTPDGMYLKPLDGGATVTLTQNEIHPKIATDGTWLYYTDQSYVLKRPADGSFGNFQKFYTTTYPDGIAIDATHVYWIDRMDNAVYRGDKGP